jgi:protocatechuate 3,4-dioxygenase alpha subunit
VKHARTPSQTVGPFYEIGLCRTLQDTLAIPSDASRTRLVGRLTDGSGEPVADGLIELWDGVGGRWGRCGTDRSGSFSFLVTKPRARAGEAPRLDLLVFARGLLRHQLTRVYFPDEHASNAADPVLALLGEAERATLVAQSESGALRFDIRLQGDRQTVFFAV